MPPCDSFLYDIHFACHIQSNMRSEFQNTSSVIKTQVIGCISGIIPTSCNSKRDYNKLLQITRHPYEPISIMECHNRFERCSLASMNIPERKKKNTTTLTTYKNYTFFVAKTLSKVSSRASLCAGGATNWTGSQAGERARCGGKDIGPCSRCSKAWPAPAGYIYIIYVLWLYTIYSGARYDICIH